MVKDESDEMPKEVQAQNGLENSEKGDEEQMLISGVKSYSLCEKTWRKKFSEASSRSTQ